jgi:excisionase family DNA binding protein
MALLTVKQVAEKLNVSESFVYGLLASGRLKHHALGKAQGAKRITEQQLSEYLTATERGGDPRLPAPKAKLAPGPFRHLKLN